LRDLKRIEYSYATDKEALAAFQFVRKSKASYRTRISPCRCLCDEAREVASQERHRHHQSQRARDKDVMQVMEALNA